MRLARVQRELLTIAVARAKAEPLRRLLRAATAIDAAGTWRDPAGASDDQRAPNTLLEVEYGEVASELVGNGIALALRLINDLEINEQILYARMENIEESSLVARGRDGRAAVISGDIPASDAWIRATDIRCP